MKIIDISKCNEEVISYINELQNKYAELDKLNKELDKSNITIFEENNYLIKENRRLNNVINELEKRCNEMLKLYDTFNDEQRFNNWKEYKVYGTISDWIEELKGSDKE